MENSAAYWIEALQLQPHPEGGFFKEVYRSEEAIPPVGLPERYLSPRNMSTSIYFLLRSEDISAFHRIKSDEIWFYHAGSSADIYIIEDRKLRLEKIGMNRKRGDQLQILLPKNSWFGSKVTDKDSFILVSCTVAPGFDFEDFELATRKELLIEYPEFEAEIIILTKA
ncbi:MAG: cupin domain-containing protein [Cytophagales bacterium]|nr:MAG: cupin domain-containing protein [Cytophagales bacterium]